MDLTLPENIREMQLPTATIIWIESFQFSKPVDFNNLDSCWILVFALNDNIEVNGKLLPPDSWSMYFAESLSPIHVRCPSGKGQSLVLELHENPYAEFNLKSMHQGAVSCPAMLSILEILYKSFGQPHYEEIWAEILTYKLLAELSHPIGRKSSFSFEEIKQLYRVVTSLANIDNSKYPMPSQLIESSKMPTHRFQRACLEIYGKSLQSILQHLKMKKAFDDILFKSRNPQTIAMDLGFKHYNNFTTSFRKYFEITPATASHYYDGSSAFS
jgi:AraC-like DNA-binding protein